MTDRSPCIEVNGTSGLRTTIFSPGNGHLLCGGHNQHVGVWQVYDGKHLGTVEADEVHCFAVSKNGSWLAAGTYYGNIYVLDAKSYRRIWMTKHGNQSFEEIHTINFSPDSGRVVTASRNRTATVWSATTGQQLQSLQHKGPVIAAKFSPHGERIATASSETVQLWDSHDGRVLQEIQLKVTPRHLLWHASHLYVVSDDTIKQFDASGSIISEWPVPKSNGFSCVALPTLGSFIAYSAGRTVTLWDLSTHAQICLTEHHEDVCSITFSPDDRLLAIGGIDGRIRIDSLSRISNSSRLHHTFQEPDVQIDHATLDSWTHDRLESAETSLTAALHQSRDPTQHLLPARALVRARLRRWDEALADAEKALSTRSSIIAYIAQSVAYAGKRQKRMAYQTCDIAFEHFHSSHVTLLLLIKAVVVFMAGEHHDAIARMDTLIDTIPFNSTCYMVQAYMHLLLGNRHMEMGNFERAIHSFDLAHGRTPHFGNHPLLMVSLMTGWRFDDLSIRIRLRHCDALYAAGRKKDAYELLLDMVKSFDDKVYTSEPVAKWVSDFVQQFLSVSESNTDADENTGIDATVDPATSTLLLGEWVKAVLAHDSWRNALLSAAGFTVSKFTIYRAVCEYLDTSERTMEASECFLHMQGELAKQTSANEEQSEWVIDFKRRFLEELEGRGDAAMQSGRHGDAISHYSALLMFGSVAPYGLFIKRSKAYLANGSPENAVMDAEKAIELDPLSPWGYGRKHAALHEKGDYRGAIQAFEQMRSTIAQSPDPGIRALLDQYIDPSKTRKVIQDAIRKAIRDSPRVLINTSSGRLCDKSEQAASFTSLPIFDELISSMTTHLNADRIERDVGEYYLYAMFSHRWEADEPPFDLVLCMAVLGLEESPSHHKLQMFCKIVKDAGLHWAWSDTCCINKSDHSVLQHALGSMFKWYEGSALTVVFLLDVPSPSVCGHLMKSVWNTRAWTFQEYHASKVVRFYANDWTLYRNIDVPNHKESPEIILEMEEATHVSTEALKALRPGLDSIREKLCLASKREATFEEDTAYSLFGIFMVSLPVVYGEGNQALGRLLSQLLSSSGDTSILSWNGRAGRFNSCLPAHTTMFNQSHAPHVPPPLTPNRMAAITDRLRDLLDHTLVTELYDRLHNLHVVSFSGQRMKLPSIVFKVSSVSVSRNLSGYTLRTEMDALGIINVKTTEDISRLDPGSLILVHPWIDYLLDRHSVGEPSSTVPLSPSSPSSNVTSPISPTPKSGWLSGWSFSRPNSPPPSASSFQSPHLLLTDKLTESLQVVGRLKQQFGAMLFAQTRRNMAEYRRVAADSMITVQVQEDVLLGLLIEGVRMLDVL